MSLGWTISEPWWEMIEEGFRRGYKSEADIPRSFASRCANQDLDAIERSERVIVLAKEGGGLSPGACGELLYAIALQRFADEERPSFVAIVGKPNHIFGSLARVYDTFEEAIKPPRSLE